MTAPRAHNTTQFYFFQLSFSLNIRQQKHTMEETPVNAAHHFANIAEEAKENEQWVKAMESHFRAAEQFLLAMDYTSDPEAIRTLKLLRSNHTRQGKDIQRRLANQSQQARANPAAEPTRSQSNPSPASSPTSQQTNNLYDLAKSAADDGADGMQGTRRRHSVAASSRLHTENSDESTSTSRSSKIDESYMVLKGNSNDDDSDPFNKFWNVVENLVQKLSNPAVAFTTVPLNVNDPAALFDPSNLYGLANPMAPAAAVPQIAGKPAVPGKGVIGGGDEAVAQSDVAEKVTAAMMESYYLVDDYQRNLAGKSGLKAPSTVTQANISGSKRSGLVDTTSVAIIPNKTLEEYAVENQQLKMMVDQLSRRVMTHEKVPRSFPLSLPCGLWH
ncbi:hypothetical protein BC938DRAFT_481732 [Jimgerdemannia flammicorona]|uniref:Uncharacterized protein n=1 Tax=Jimgerdemannia flammicorona TaxID=994334 RepID=A0A433QWN3_9FUNG|nr:hypothetical protein BC938DRAFT_481732 [Jimgerdemannia flammicorona]